VSAASAVEALLAAVMPPLSAVMPHTMDQHFAALFADYQGLIAGVKRAA
jgi:hypothetical protein